MPASQVVLMRGRSCGGDAGRHERCGPGRRVSRSASIRASDLIVVFRYDQDMHRVVALAYDGLSPFELSIAVETFGLQRPELNVTLQLDGETIEIDALWRAERIAVELDSRQFHDTPLAFERDRRRDRRLSAAGWRPVRITWRQITDERAAVGRDLSAVLSAKAA